MIKITNENNKYILTFERRNQQTNNYNKIIKLIGITTIQFDTIITENKGKIIDNKIYFNNETQAKQAIQKIWAKAITERLFVI